MYIHRVNENQIFKSFASHYVTALLGARQIGKTTLVSEYKEQHKNYQWVVFNMDSLAERDKVNAGLLHDMIETQSHKKIGSHEKIWVIIDEAQKCANLFDQIKILFDRYKDTNQIKFILTGSGHLSLHKFSAETLAGRIQLLNLREFNLSENARLKNNITLPAKSIFEGIYQAASKKYFNEYLSIISPFRLRLLEALKEQLVWGGLPDVLKKTTQEERIKYLQDYLQTYLEKDIRAIETISDLELYRNLMNIAAEQTGSIRDNDRVKQALGCARDTLKKYKGYLLATLMYQEIYPYISNTLKRIVKSPKGYLFDNGLISYLTGIDDFNVLVKTGQIGHRLENWFLKELKVSLDREIKYNKIFFWRTSSGVEVDFIVEIKPNIFPFEVTYSTQIDKKKLRNLKIFLKDEPKAKNGYYIYMGDYHYDKKERIHFLPCWAIC
jgi:predicted AAA+ superfamily ATPase